MRRAPPGKSRGARAICTDGARRIEESCLQQRNLMEPKLRVFLCHATEDKPSVRKLYRRLTESGFAPWLDEEDLLAGDDWDLTICKVVRESDIIAVCLSKCSTSKRGFVQKEIKIALDAAQYHPDGAVYIVPIRLDKCDIPERLAKWHAINLFDRGGYNKLERALSRQQCMSELWESVPDAKPTPYTDPATLQKLLKATKSDTWLTVQDYLNEFVDTIARFAETPDADATLQMCMTSRAVFASLFMRAHGGNTFDDDTFDLVELVFDTCLKVLPNAPTDKRSSHFVDCIVGRAENVRKFRAEAKVLETITWPP